MSHRFPSENTYFFGYYRNTHLIITKKKLQRGKIVFNILTLTLLTKKNVIIDPVSSILLLVTFQALENITGKKIVRFSSISVPYVFWVADSEFFTSQQNFLPEIRLILKKWRQNEYYQKYFIFVIKKNNLGMITIN